MKISMEEVKVLRAGTGAGVMDCKRALTEANGDKKEAAELLRKWGIIKADKIGTKIAAEGLCRIAKDGTVKAAVVEVNSETDFVAKNDKFRAFVEKAARQALDSEARDIDTFMAESWAEDPEKTVKDVLLDMIAVIKENLSIRRFKRIEDKEGCVVTYLHGQGRIGVIVDAQTAVVSDEVKTALTNVAMQIAAMNPRYINRAEIPDDYKEHEMEICLERAAAENNKLPENKRVPQNIVERIAAGRLDKRCREICLLDQVYVRAENGKQTVGQYLDQVGKANGTEITIKEFVRFETGEGIEKKQDNFAEEVMAQVNAAAK